MTVLEKSEYGRVLIETLKTSISDNSKNNFLTKEIDLALPLDAYLDDSLERLEFVMALEDALGIVFDVKKITECKSLADIIKLAES